MNITARVWFKDPESEQSQSFAKAIQALEIKDHNHTPIHRYDPYVPHVSNDYSRKYDHRFVFWNSGSGWEDELDMKAFILMGKWCGGYVEVSICGLDFYHLGDYIGNDPQDTILSWEQESKLSRAGIKHPLDKKSFVDRM